MNRIKIFLCASSLLSLHNSYSNSNMSDNAAMAILGSAAVGAGVTGYYAYRHFAAKTVEDVRKIDNETLKYFKDKPLWRKDFSFAFTAACYRTQLSDDEVKQTIKRGARGGATLLGIAGGICTLVVATTIHSVLFSSSPTPPAAPVAPTTPAAPGA